jgi:hypothetical protein
MKIKRFKDFNKVNEGISRTYDEFIDDLRNELMGRGLTDEEMSQYIDYWHGKGYLHLLWEEGSSPDDAIEQLKEDDDKIKWYK